MHDHLPCRVARDIGHQKKPTPSLYQTRIVLNFHEYSTVCIHMEMRAHPHAAVVNLGLKKTTPPPTPKGKKKEKTEKSVAITNVQNTSNLCFKSKILRNPLSVFLPYICVMTNFCSKKKKNFKQSQSVCHCDQTYKNMFCLTGRRVQSVKLKNLSLIHI